MKTNGTVSQVGLDSHRKFSTVTTRDASGKVVWRRRLEHVDRERLRKQLGEWPKGVPVILEATFGWGWLSDELKRAGLDPHLASSRKIAAWRDARGIAKSNRTDADLLSELWSQKDRWWEVWLAPPEVRDQREQMRFRMTLVRLQTGMKNRIHAILHRHGIVHELADLFGTAGRRMLQGLALSGDERLSPTGQATLKGYLQLLDSLRRQIAKVTREVRTQVERTARGKQWCTLPGVGSILAHTILAEIGPIERFRSFRHLASYALLAPRAYDSGEESDKAPQGRHVGHIGRRTLKWAFIEAAHGAVRSGGRFRKIFDAYTDGGKKNRNRGYIVVGHELCRIGYAMDRHETEYMEEPPPRPGSSKTRSVHPHAPLTTRSDKANRARETPGNSRPGTGQPDGAMVAVG